MAGSDLLLTLLGAVALLFWGVRMVRTGLTRTFGATLRSMLARASRNRINSGNNWLFSPDVKAASHVSRRVMKIKSGSEILLLTDGFLALASDYGAYNADSLMDGARSKGLVALGEQLRAVEADDSGGDKFPRFKKSDDATALLLRLT